MLGLWSLKPWIYPPDWRVVRRKGGEAKEVTTLSAQACVAAAAR
jgi:hypothetical protein